jgi:hypothetical protein
LAKNFNSNSYWNFKLPCDLKLYLTIKQIKPDTKANILMYRVVELNDNRLILVEDTCQRPDRALKVGAII